MQRRRLLVLVVAACGGCDAAPPVAPPLNVVHVAPTPVGPDGVWVPPRAFAAPVREQARVDAEDAIAAGRPVSVTYGMPPLDLVNRRTGLPYAGYGCEVTEDMILYTEFYNLTVDVARREGRLKIVAPPAPTPDPLLIDDDEPANVPAYRLRDPDLQVRAGDQIVPASAADNAVAKRYATWKGKGPKSPAGDRITILTAKTSYAPDEAIRVIHVYEATRPGLTVHVMGPKPIDGETIDGRLVTPPALPRPYDGLVLESPEVDFNYEVTQYRLPAGRHVIRWKPAALTGASPSLESNEIVLDVR